MTKMTHRYAVNPNVASPGLAGTALLYRANGMFDPEQATGGHQPMYFDQLAALYDHFCVIGSKMTVTFSPAAGNTVPVQFNLGVDDDATIPSNSPVSLAEYTDSNYGIIPVPGSPPITRTMTWSAKKYFGKDPLDNPELQGSVSADPTEQSYFTVTLQPMDGLSINQAIYITIVIEYIAIWKELKSVAAS